MVLAKTRGSHLWIAGPVSGLLSGVFGIPTLTTSKSMKKSRRILNRERLPAMSRPTFMIMFVLASEIARERAVASATLDDVWFTIP